jgi:PAS domain S-box-containing protein
VRKDGSRLWANVVVTALRDGSGRLVGFVKIVRDLTERRRAELALRESEESLSVTLNSIGDGVLATDAEARVLRMNPVAEKLTGWTQAEARGRPFTDVFRIVHERTRAPADDPVARVLREGKAVTLANHTALLARDGTETPIADSAAPIRDADGSVRGVVLVFRDVGAERAAKAAVEEANRFLDSVIEHLPAMVFMKDARELRFERFNRAAEQLLGIARAEMLGKNDYDFFPPEQAAFFQARDRETLARAEVLDIPEEPIQTARGERWLHTRKVPLLGADGAPAHLLGVSIDVTEQRQTAAALRRAARAAEAANRELEAFSYAVAHDLRAPLRAMSGFAQVLLEDYADKLDGEGVDCLREIHANAVRMGALIDALLSLSRVTRTELRREPVDLGAIAREILARLAAAEPGRAVETIIADGLHAQLDPALARTLMENLLGNAWKFTARSARARIEVGAVDHDGERAFFVRDDGTGFDMAYASKLFTPFQRLHSTAEFPGTGIGLATVQRIVARHGGRVWAEGRLGEGAVFYFTMGGAA